MLLRSKGKNFRISGNCVFFDRITGHFCCKRKTLLIEDGIIRSVLPYEEAGSHVLDEHCVIFPGLSDLHSHVDYNMIQVWDSMKETKGVPWDNRHEWRKSIKYREEISGVHKLIDKEWKDVIIRKEGEDILLGDIMLYFCELQAVCGGTTVLQENGCTKNRLGSLESDMDDDEPEFRYSFSGDVKMFPSYSFMEDEEDDAVLRANVAENHVKYLVLRSTGVAKDLGFPDGKEISSIVDLYRPGESGPQNMNPETYLPHRKTGEWQITDALYRDKLTDFIASKDKRQNGFLIHLAEGRAGNLFGGSDPEWKEWDQYSRNEFLEFKNYILDCEKEGLFTEQDVIDTHINFIHGCGIDLSNEEDRDFMKKHGIGMIWSPVSNLLLYGDTPKTYDYLWEDGVLTGIGSDWSPSGSKHAWDECKFARKFMKKHAADKTNIEEKILKAVTVNASEMLGCEKIGNIQEGAFADLFVLRSEKKIEENISEAFSAFFESSDQNVELVMLGGNAVYGEEACISGLIDEREREWLVQLESKEEALAGKRLLLSEYFRKADFREIYGAYVSKLEEAGIPISLIRSEEDAEYRRAITDLTDKYA
ncbi:MAG: amidohydrolase family protein [Lachnospiraceae bacterium]|nr:amidohydrolase family protein [Lachnospiraceae bacterium]